MGRLREISPLVRDLARPAAYPAGTAEVTVRTTHGAWVFLTKDEVWKVKRPVDYGFLDYSDAEKRRRCCEDEVRLGARLAPDVYRGVVPVFLGLRGHSFVGPGVVIDHAVRMRRLPDEESALALLRAGRLETAHLEALVARLAPFYAAARVTPEHGSPEILAAAVDENHRQSRPFAGRYVDPPVLDGLVAVQRAALRDAWEHLRRRAAAGRVREGHGDLRLEHVYFPDGAPPLVIDPIEFNVRFRCQDVALDVAFLAMELEANARPDLAAYLLSRFARVTDDHGLYPVIDLYQSYRACVRAKVACFVAADPATPPLAARARAAEAGSLFALARTLLGRDPRARAVVAVGGVIAAGKTALADRLCESLGMPVVSSDAVRKHLGGVALTEVAPPELYAGDVTARVYDEMLARARDVLASGRGVVLDATHRTPEVRAAAAELARAHGRPFLFVELDCDDRTLRERLRARALAPAESDAREALLPTMRRTFSPATELAPHERVRLDGAQPLDVLVERVRSHLPPRVERPTQERLP